MAGIISNKYTGTDSASPLSWGLVVEEVDGVPTVGNVNTIIVSNGTLTDNGGGVVTILTSGGGGGGIPSGPQYAVQLNDGAGNFVGSANYTYDYAAFELTVNGKIIMNNIVEDTTGIDFSPVAANPGTTVAETLWSNSTDANNLYYGANPVLTDASTFTLFDIEDDTTSTTTISRFDNLEMSGGTGISTALAAGPELIFTNTGVTSIVAGTGITISGPTGAVTITSSTTGTVTSVATANSTFVSLAGGPITTTGTLTASLSATGTADATTFLRGDNTWTVPSSGMVTFTVSGDAGPSQTISDGNNLQILGSTTAGSGADLAGVLDTVAAAGDLLYVETREMTGATGVADGATGFAPKALTGEQEYYLAGDATWKVLPINYSWTVSDGTTTDIISDGETVQFQGTATQLVATVAAGTPALVTYALVNVNTSGSGAYAYPSNITVDLQGRITAITASGAPGGGTVTSITFSDGAATDTITTTGTIEIVGGTAIDSTLNPATGVFTMTSTGVNSLANVGGTYAGTGASYVIPSAATGSGIDLELTTTGVAAGSYSASNITVDAYGRLTAASDGSASIVNTKFYIEDDAANNELVSTNDTILLKEGLGGVSVVVSNPDTVTYGLDTTGVAAASYIAADITVDAYGRLSAASQGTQFSGGANVGIVPTAAAAANNTYLEKDGTWTDPLAGLAAGDGISFAAPTISVSLTASTGLQFNGGTAALEGTTFTTANIGMVPAPGAINNYFLRDDGTWVAGGGSGTVTSVATANSTFVSLTGGPITTTGTLTASLSATGTASAGTFLRGDNTWATPGGGFSNFNISDGVTTQTINSTDTITFTGGTALTGAVSATDTVTYSLDNTAVTPGSYTYGSFTVDQQGRLTAASSGGAPGTMSSWILTGDSGTQTITNADTVDIAGGTGITTAASATDTLTVTLADTAVTPGSYTYSSLTVDQQGRLTAASSGTSPGTMSSFTAAGSSGPSQTISDGDIFTIAQGTGITSVASATDTITITNTGVTSNVAGTGISVSGATGAVTISNTGVTSIVAGTNISISGATGAVTISSTDQFTGTVTSVATSSGTFVDVTGGPITTTGTITGDLSATGTASATTFLRGDNTWASPAGSFTFDVEGSSGTTETISSGDTLIIAEGTGITAVSSVTDTVTITNTLPFNSLTLAGDTGSETVVDQDTITIAGGTGLTTVAAATDTVTVTLDDTLVTPGSYTYSSFTVDQQGRLTDAASGSAPGTMSDFIISDAAAATQIVGNGDTITFVGGTALTSAVTATDTVTFNLDNTSVTPGSYTYSSLTVDAQGRLTAASSGSAPGTMSSFNLDGDSGPTQTISDSDTMTIAGGTALSSVAVNFDTVTLNLDNTAVAAGSYTYSSLTVDAQGRLTAASSGVVPGTMDDFIISDGVTTQTISDGETLTFDSGTFIDQTVTATDTVTSDLSATGSAGSGTFLRGDNTWATPAGGFSNFDIDSDPATVTETINSGETITFTGGPGLTAAVSVTDTVTLSLDNTAVSAGSYTYSSLTVDAQGRLTAASSGAAPGTMDDWILSGDSGTPQTIADGNTVDIEGGTAITTTTSSTDTLTIDLEDTAVTPGSYTYSSLTVDQQGRLTAASSGAAPGTMDNFIISDGSTTQTIANGDTLTFTASTGISAIVSATDTLTITNTGVTSNVAGTGISVSGATGAVTISNTLPFNSLSLAGDSGPTQTISDGDTITIAGGTGLSSVSNVADTITVNLDNTAVTAGSYGSATEVGEFTVDAQGRLTLASDVAITFPFSSFDIVTDPATTTETISDGGPLTFASGTFIDQTVAATDTVTGDLSATGTASASTFLRGDNTWASPAGSFTFDVEGSSGTTETISSGDTLIIAEGTGITSVASNPDTITITNTGVTSAVAGSGIGVSAATGAVTISNTGVTSIVAGTNISISGATGAVTINSTDQYDGTVTSVATSSGTFVDVTGGPITTTGTITGDLSATGTASATTFLRGDNTWGTPVGTATSFDLTGDTGTTEAVTDGDTVTIAGGTGLSSVSSNPDTVTLNLDNTAVSGGSYTYASFTVDAQGRLTAASSGATPGTMSDWTLDGDLGAPQTISNSDTVMMAGGTGITTTASATDTLTVDLDDTAVTPASYTYASITVDQQGRLTSASSGTPPSTFTFDAAGSSGSAQVISSGDTLTIAQGTGITSVAGATDTITITNTLPFNSLTLAGDSGSETVLDGDTITIAGGTGLTTAAAATDTVTVTLDDTAVTPASYTYGSFTVDQQGRLTAASSGSAPGTMSSFNLTGDTGTPEVISDGDTVDIAGGTGISTVASATDTVTVNLDDTAVVATGYGDATNVPSFTVDAQGRLTAAADVAITFPTVVTDLTGTTPINVDVATGSVTISSDVYAGTTVVGYVPAGGGATTYLRGDGTWVNPPGALPFNNLTLAADTGISETVVDGDTITFAGGTGLASVVSATDTITFNLEDTIVTPTAYGSATEVATFTVDQQGRLTAAADVAITYPGTADLTATYVGYGSASNLLTGTANYTWTNASNLLTLGSAGAATTIKGAVGTASEGSALTLAGGAGFGTDKDGGTITLTPGAKTGTGTRGSLVLDYSTYPAADATGVLTSSGAGVLSWGTPAGTYTWTLDGDSGSEAIDSADTVTLTGGSTGLTFASAAVGAAKSATLAGTLDIGYGGTGLATLPTAGQLLIGNTTASDYDLATLTAGTGISIANADGSITITNSLPGGSTTFDITGDGAATETISDGATFTLAGGTGLTSAVTSVDTVTYNLDDTAVTLGSYGDATNVPSFTVDQQGRLTAAADVAITFPTVVTDLTATTPINVDVSTGSVTISSDAYTGGTGIGYVPTGGSAADFLSGDGTWKVPAGSFTSFDVDGDSGTVQTITDGNTLNILGGSGLTSVASATDTVTLSLDNTGVVAGTYIAATITVDAKGRLTAASASGAGTYTFDIEDDVGNSQTISSGNTLTFLDGTFITPTVSAVDSVTHELSASGTASTTTFLRGDNQWATPITGTSALTATQIGFGDGANLLTGSSDFTFSGTTGIVTLNSAAGATATITSSDMLNITSSAVSTNALQLTFTDLDSYLQIDDGSGAIHTSTDFVVIGENATSGALKVTNALLLNTPTANDSATGDTYTLLLQGLDDQNAIRIGFGTDQSSTSYQYMIGMESISDAGAGDAEQWFGGFSTLNSTGAAALDEVWVPAFKQYMQNWTVGPAIYEQTPTGVPESVDWGEDGNGPSSKTLAVNYYQRQQVLYDRGAPTLTLDYDTHAGAVIFIDQGGAVNLPETNVTIGDTYEIFITPNPVPVGVVTINPGATGAGEIDGKGLGVAATIDPTAIFGAVGSYRKGIKLICIGSAQLVGPGPLWGIINGVN